MFLFEQPIEQDDELSMDDTPEEMSPEEGLPPGEEQPVEGLPPGEEQPVEGQPPPEAVQPPEPPDELVPVRKFRLIKKLNQLQVKLAEYNVKSDDLDTLLLFSKELSYDTLVKISSKLVDDVQTSLKKKGDENGKKV